ncbi:MAG: hypothetical protein JSW10_02240 [Pseudomonadota bacterium]|nr:MAG: hypothetical protein JSW10_02240 [Pseudomonadota bacterium]
MTDDALVCWKCGASLEELPVPFSRYAECPACRAEMHACRMCAFYDTSVSKQCREPIAEEVKEKTRANFCGYFQPRPGAFVAGGDTRAREAQARLADLFGETESSAGDIESEKPGMQSEAEQAQARLEALLGGQRKGDDD